MGWHDSIESTHQSHEFRVSTPDEWRIRAVGGVFWEDFQIKDDMNFLQKEIPSCTPENLAAALAGGPICLGNVAPVQAAIDPTPRNDNTNFGEDLERGYKQTAVFGSLDFDLIPKVLTITVGTRYYKYTEQEVGSQYGTGSGCINIPNGDCVGTPIGGGLDPDPVTGVRDKDFHKATFTGFKSRANITWHPTTDTMVYYTFSQGYRPGAFNRTTKGVAKIWINNGTGAALPNGVAAVKAPSGCTAAVPVCADGSNWSQYDTIATQYVKPLSYAPDELVNNELGFKTQFFNRRLQVNGSIYQMNWKNVQTQIYNPPVYGNTTFGLNGPDYRVKGFELQITALATDNLTLTGSVSYNDAKQSNSPCITAAGVTFYTPQNPTAAGQCITQVRASGKNIAIPNPLGSEGDTPAFSPKLQYNLRARYDWTVSEYKAFALVGLNHTDSMNNTPSSFPSGEGVVIPGTTWLRYNMPSYNTYDASIGVAKDAWEVTLFGQNLSNENASTFTSTGQFIKAEVPLRPRVLGVKIGLKF
jgi:outer membrane receptor protein involved in Fe transport